MLELHDVGDRLEVATALLESHDFSVVTARDFPPQNVMIYATKLQTVKGFMRN